MPKVKPYISLINRLGYRETEANEIVLFVNSMSRNASLTLGCIDFAVKSLK